MYNLNKDKSNQIVFGFFLALLFSIVGLFAGMLYPAQSVERLTFIEGWKKGAIFNFIITLIIIIIALTSK